jgi:hypothetical protein
MVESARTQEELLCGVYWMAQCMSRDPDVAGVMFDIAMERLDGRPGPISARYVAVTMRGVGLDWLRRTGRQVLCDVPAPDGMGLDDTDSILGVLQLTGREAALVAGRLEGLTDGEVAVRLGVSPGTISLCGAALARRARRIGL